jgi:putative endonuclease
MTDTHSLGQKGENRATDYLKNEGYKILVRNWTWGKYEIDIIAEKDNMVVFVEVKSRSEDYLDDLIKIVTPAKQKSIIFAADGYIRKFKIDKESRFDVLFII